MTKKIVYSLLFSGIIWITGLIGFLNFIITPRSQPLPAADALIILTGGIGRLDKGFKLLKKAKVQKVFISGVESRVKLEDLLKIYHFPAELSRYIDLDKKAIDTQTNAKQTACWIKYNGYGTVILVTSYYHIPRSLIEFRRFAPGLKIIPYPTFPEKFSLSTLLKNPTQWKTIVEEYHKYCIAKLRSFS